MSPIHGQTQDAGLALRRAAGAKGRPSPAAKSSPTCAALRPLQIARTRIAWSAVSTCISRSWEIRSSSAVVRS
jgi:hypothetical protein